MARARQVIQVFETETFRALSRIEKQQHPFAFAKSLTMVAEGARKKVQQQTREEFDLHTAFIPKGIRKSGAKKSEIKNRGKSSASVFTLPRINNFMPIHEEGGTRTANAGGEGKDKGKYLTIPGNDFEDRMVTKTGKTKKRFKPGQLLKNYKGRNNRRPLGKRRGRARRTPFIIRARSSGTPMIVRRTSKARKPLEVLYVFAKRTRYKATWDFEKTVDEYVPRAFPIIYKRNLKLAVRSAR